MCMAYSLCVLLETGVIEGLLRHTVVDVYGATTVYNTAKNKLK